MAKEIQNFVIITNRESAGYKVTPGKLHYTIGTSHSGKSTYCNEWVRFFGASVNCWHENYRPRSIACSDNIRLALHGKRYNSHAEPMVFATKQLHIKALLDRGHDVIVDGTHTTRTSIRRILEIDPNAEGIVFDIPLDVCLSRINLTQQHDMGPVITRHYRQMQELLAYGLDKVREELLEEIRIRRGEPKVV